MKHVEGYCFVFDLMQTNPRASAC